MFKKFLFALAVVAGVMGAKADFLWWQVSPDAGKTFTTAQLYATNGSTETGLGEAVGAADLNTDTMKGTTIETTKTDISGYTGSTYSFFVELVTYTADGENIASTLKTDAVSYTDLVSGGYITGPGVGLPNMPGPEKGGAKLGTGGGSVIPEPTSGMLMLLGGALMALRRRRRA